MKTQWTLDSAVVMILEKHTTYAMVAQPLRTLTPFVLLLYLLLRRCRAIEITETGKLTIE